ncbi:MAG: GntR family transcriptional regulator [Lachnospiraceae bacterium]|nr:GntR family transcriptional regulator [Lachnospiraceae bacterium]
MPWDLLNDRPIYTQLLEQIKRRIVSGEYQAGERLPSVREYAAEAGVNPNTMQRALAELERDGLVRAERTTGRFITEDEKLIQKLREELAKEQIEIFIQAMQALGYSRTDSLELVASCCQKGE